MSDSPELILDYTKLTTRLFDNGAITCDGPMSNAEFGLESHCDFLMKFMANLYFLVSHDLAQRLVYVCCDTGRHLSLVNA